MLEAASGQTAERKPCFLLKLIDHCLYKHPAKATTYMNGKNFRQFRLITWTSSIIQFVHLVPGEGM